MVALGVSILRPRGAGVEALTAGPAARLDPFLVLGTTSLDAPTGYGLTVADEP